MKTCQYCKSEIPDDSVRCRFCSSWLDSTSSATNSDRSIVYVLDRSIVKFTKFALAILAIFLIVGAFFYGFDIKQASDEVELAADEVQHALTETKEARKSVVVERGKVDALRGEVEETAEQVRALHDEILQKRNQVRVMVADIQTSLDKTDARSLFQELITKHLSGILTQSQMAAVRESFGSTMGTLEQILEQPSLTLLRVKEALAEAHNAVPVKVAVLSNGGPIPLDELRERIMDFRSFIAQESDSTDRSQVSDHTVAVVSVAAAIAPSANFMLLEVLGQEGFDDALSIRKGLEYAISTGARIIVMPFGTYDPEAFKKMEIFDHPASNNVLFIASAGNDDSDAFLYPAAFPQVFAVASTNASDVRATFSSYGDWIDAAAPGENILALTANGELDTFDGGSFSTAIVSGVAALVTSIRPRLSGQDVAQILRLASVNVDEANSSFTGLLGAGRVDALNSIRIANAYLPL